MRISDYMVEDATVFRHRRSDWGMLLGTLPSQIAGTPVQVRHDPQEVARTSQRISIYSVSASNEASTSRAIPHTHLRLASSILNSGDYQEAGHVQTNGAGILLWALHVAFLPPFSYWSPLPDLIHPSPA